MGIVESALNLPKEFAQGVVHGIQKRREIGEKIAGPVGGFVFGGGLTDRVIEKTLQTGLNLLS